MLIRACLSVSPVGLKYNYVLYYLVHLFGKTNILYGVEVKVGGKVYFGSQILERSSIGEYLNVPVLVNTGTFLVYQYSSDWAIVNPFYWTSCVEDEARIRLWHCTCQSLTEGKLDWELGRFYTSIAWKCAIYVL